MQTFPNAESRHFHFLSETSSSGETSAVHQLPILAGLRAGTFYRFLYCRAPPTVTPCPLWNLSGTVFSKAPAEWERSKVLARKGLREISRKVPRTVQNATSDTILHLTRQKKPKPSSATSSKAASIPPAYQGGFTEIQEKRIKTFFCATLCFAREPQSVFF